jgi:hypothetical protein
VIVFPRPRRVETVAVVGDLQPNPTSVIESGKPHHEIAWIAVTERVAYTLLAGSPHERDYFLGKA